MGLFEEIREIEYFVYLVEPPNMKESILLVEVLQLDYKVFCQQTNVNHYFDCVSFDTELENVIIAI